MPTTAGLDASYWQAVIDWPRVRATGREFAFLKATEGESYTDPTFEANWAGAGECGMLRGAYCFFRPNQDPRKQAAHFIGVVQSSKGSGELAPAIDLEVLEGVSKETVTSRIRTWLEEVEGAFGRRAMIYAHLSFFEDSLSQPRGAPPAWAKDRALWLAWFPSHYSAGMRPLLPRGWPTWSFWQYTGKGRIDGIPANVDLDLFNGSKQDLYRFAGMPVPSQISTDYTVAASDTLDSIAARHRVSLEELVGATPQLLSAGDKLTIPAASIGDAGNDASRSSSSPPMKGRWRQWSTQVRL